MILFLKLHDSVTLVLSAFIFMSNLLHKANGFAIAYLNEQPVILRNLWEQLSFKVFVLF